MIYIMNQEMQIKTTMRQNFTLTRMTTIRKTNMRIETYVHTKTCVTVFFLIDKKVEIIQMSIN